MGPQRADIAADRICFIPHFTAGNLIYKFRILKADLYNAVEKLLGIDLAELRKLVQKIIPLVPHRHRRFISGGLHGLDRRIQL